LFTRWIGGDPAAGSTALQRLMGMALVGVAPLIALLALAATRGRWRLLALPAALGAVLGGGLGIPPAAGLLSMMAPGAALAVIAVLTLLIATVAALLSVRMLPVSILPQRVQL
jgi:hypothetical protein